MLTETPTRQPKSERIKVDGSKTSFTPAQVYREINQQLLAFAGRTDSKNTGASRNGECLQVTGEAGGVF